MVLKSLSVEPVGQERKGSVGSPLEWRACTRGKARGTFSVLHLRNLRGSSLRATRIIIAHPPVLQVGSVEETCIQTRQWNGMRAPLVGNIPHGLSRPSFRKRRDQVFIIIVDAPNDSIAR